MGDIELLGATVRAYEAYIDAYLGIPENERSDLLMVARTLVLEAEERGLI